MDHSHKQTQSASLHWVRHMVGDTMNKNKPINTRRTTYNQIATMLGVSMLKLRRIREEFCDHPDLPPTANNRDAWQEFFTEVVQNQEEARDLSGLPGRNPYDKAVRERKITYAESKTREQSLQEHLKNEKLRAEIQVAKGNLVNAKQVSKAAEIVVHAFMSELKGLDARVVGKLRNIPAAIKTQVRDIIADELQALSRDKIKRAVELANDEV